MRLRYPIKYEDKTSLIDKLNKEIKSLGPIPKEFLEQVKAYFRIGLTYSSNAIEGNTLTETETKVVLEDGLTVSGKPLKDHYEASGHSEAFDFVYSFTKRKTITEEDILKIHKLFYYRIDNDHAGQYRKAPVIITGTDYVPPSPLKISRLMKVFVKKIPAMREKFHPVIFSAKLHEELVNVHPFVDGNGRTARLLMNLALFQAGHTITVIPPVLRADYIALIKRSQTGQKDSTGFENFISCMVYESTKRLCTIVKKIQVNKC